MRLLITLAAVAVASLAAAGAAHADVPAPHNPSAQVVVLIGANDYGFADVTRPAHPR